MRTIAYCSPLVPVEWIAAHGLRPQWLSLRAGADRPSVAGTRGVCPYAGAVVDAALSGIDDAALVLTTVCDQMRVCGGAGGKPREFSRLSAQFPFHLADGGGPRAVS